MGPVTDESTMLFFHPRNPQAHSRAGLTRKPHRRRERKRRKNEKRAKFFLARTSYGVKYAPPRIATRPSGHLLNIKAANPLGMGALHAR